MKKKSLALSVALTLNALPNLAMAESFEFGAVRGSFVSTIAAGTGIRAASPSCGLILQGATGNGAPAGCLAPTSGLSDQGNLNYDKGDPFTAYVKGTHELLLNFPADVTFMARGTWIRDFAATHTTGYLSSLSPVSLPPAASDDLRSKARLLDFWVSKSFDIGEQRARVRLGNQVVNWGESLFFTGGINATSPLDYQRLALPGTQVKEALLANQMINVASGLGNGLNMEAYYQFNWNKSYLPPAASYWSTANSLGVGNETYGASEREARDRGQWGLSLKWQPDSLPASFGLYAMNYHDKLPALQLDQTTFATQWLYPEDRKLYGISANFPVGDWAVGTELSYRPKDAVALHPAYGCTVRNGKCWVDQKRWQWSMNGIYSFSPSNAAPLLNLVGASTANLLAEVAAVHYPDLKDSYDGDPVAAGYSGWGQETDPLGTPVRGGTRTSAGLAVDFSLNYENSLISGWQVVPGVYYYQALSGRTPNLVSQFMRGAKSANFYVNFIRNPASWQVTLNYSTFWGGRSALDNPVRDRDYVGLNASYTF